MDYLLWTSTTGTVKYVLFSLDKGYGISIPNLGTVEQPGCPPTDRVQSPTLQDPLSTLRSDPEHLTRSSLKALLGAVQIPPPNKLTHPESKHNNHCELISPVHISFVAAVDSEKFRMTVMTKQVVEERKSQKSVMSPRLS